ncbi:hypothetical protein [Arthrobacter sp. NyZ413]|uniref:hypothetical protein n=1 Tax=Arthrobacter sp. NyZ413 TaxID=3144669 RepID=UPI003BF7D8F2
MSLADYEAMEVEAYRLGTPANAAHLLESIAQHRTGAVGYRRRPSLLLVVNPQVEVTQKGRPRDHQTS